MASKSLIRAVLVNDFNLLSKFAEDTEHVYSLGVPRSVDIELNALDYAVKHNRLEMIQLLLDLDKKSFNRCAPPNVELKHMVSSRIARV